MRKLMVQLTYSKKCRSHVVLHILVIERHDLDETLQSSNSYLVVGRLGRLTNHLHNEVSLRLQDKYRMSFSFSKKVIRVTVICEHYSAAETP